MGSLVGKDGKPVAGGRLWLQERDRKAWRLTQRWQDEARCALLMGRGIVMPPWREVSCQSVLGKTEQKHVCALLSQTFESGVS